MINQEHLTQPDPEVGKMIERTPPGMAHWAGTGPLDKRCSDCRWFMGQFWKSELHDGRCSKYIQFMLANGAAKVPVFRLPPTTAACRYFEQRTELRKGEMKINQQRIKHAAQDEILAAIKMSADKQSPEIATAMRAIAAKLGDRWGIPAKQDTGQSD